MQGNGGCVEALRRISSLIGESETGWMHGPIRRLRELTDREFEVFVLLGRGLSNQATSELLFVTERTVKAHVTRILAKLQLESRLQVGLVAQAYLFGVALTSCAEVTEEAYAV